MRKFMCVMMFLISMVMTVSATVVPDHDVGDQIIQVDQMDQSPMVIDQMIGFENHQFSDGTIVKIQSVETNLKNDIIKKAFFHGDVGWCDSPGSEIEQPPSQMNVSWLSFNQNKDPSGDQKKSLHLDNLNWLG